MILTIGNKRDESDVKGTIEDRIDAKEEIKKNLYIVLEKRKERSGKIQKSPYIKA